MAEFDLYLASASPRRRELLSQIGISFQVIDDLDVEESQNTGESPERFVARVARDKALAGVSRIQERNLPIHPVLGADTCIALDSEILGKPADRHEGISMLQRLAGRRHRVLTAICIINGSKGRKEYRALSQSLVSFTEISTTEIEQYWETGEPEDKAGAYAIQGYAARFISDLHGSYSGVVGLPLYELSELLAEISSSD